MGGVGPVVCEHFLFGGACICILVNGAGSLISGVQCKCPVVSFEVSMGLA